LIWSTALMSLVFQASLPEIRNVAETLKVGCFRPGTAHFKGKIDEVLAP